VSGGTARTVHTIHAGVGVLRIKSEDLHCGIGEPLEAAENHLGLERNRTRQTAEQLALERAHSSLDLLHLLRTWVPQVAHTPALLLESLGNVIDGAAAKVRETVHTLQLRVQERLPRDSCRGRRCRGWSS